MADYRPSKFAKRVENSSIRQVNEVKNDEYESVGYSDDDGGDDNDDDDDDE